MNQEPPQGDTHMPRLDNPRAFDRQPPNLMMIDRKWWRSPSRRAQEPQRADLRSIVNQSVKLLMRQIAGRRLVVDCEAAMQLHLSRILHQLGTLYEFGPEEQFLVQLEAPLKLSGPSPKGESTTPRADIVIAFGCHSFFTTCAIELKYFKKSNARTSHNRYDVYADLANLEKYRAEFIDETYLFVATDDPTYATRSSSGAATKELNLESGHTVGPGTTVTYQGKRAPGKPITLIESYTFDWEIHSIWGKAVDEMYTLLIHRSATRDA
jgi:hypothetical protein